MEDLSKNNNKNWFEEHKDEFKKHQDEFKQLVNQIREGLEKEDKIEKHKVFRIYRDVRFSKDKTPYKSHLAGAFTRLGADRRGGYYLHLKPGASFIAVGFWDPNKEDLHRIRKEFEMDVSELKNILEAKELISVWGEMQGDKLKTAPKGFDREHPHIELLRFKQFIFTRPFSDKEVYAGDFKEEVIQSYKTIRPFFDYMSEVLTTDLNGESVL